MLELMIVIIVIAILITLSVPQYQVMRERAIAAEAVSLLSDYIRRNVSYAVEVEVGTPYFPNSKYWTFPSMIKPSYDIGDSGKMVSITITATRKDGPYAGTYITLHYKFREPSNIITWIGNHPGVPKE